MARIQHLGTVWRITPARPRTGRFATAADSKVGLPAPCEPEIDAAPDSDRRPRVAGELGVPRLEEISPDDGNLHLEPSATAYSSVSGRKLRNVLRVQCTDVPVREVNFKRFGRFQRRPRRDLVARAGSLDKGRRSRLLAARDRIYV